MKTKHLFTLTVMICLSASWTAKAQHLSANGKQGITSIEERLTGNAPVLVCIGQKDTLRFAPDGNRFIAQSGNLEAVLHVEKPSSVEGKRWSLRFENKGDTRVDSVSVLPLYQTVGIADDKYADQPTVRWFSGSIWRDAQYPPIAFVEHEKRFLTNNNCGYWDVLTETSKTFKPLLEFGGDNSGKYLPMIQFSLRSGDERVGFTALLEWSSKWKIGATFTHITDEQLSSPSDFRITADYYLNNMSVEPQETLETPPVHLIYSRGKNWDAFTNDVHRYILNEIAPQLKSAPSPLPVSYDSWFGIAEHFDVNSLKREADKAAEIGCEYFTLDAGWADPIWGSTNVNKEKFPNGIEELAGYVRSKGMRFGLWTTLEHGGHTDFWKPEVQKHHIENLEKFVKDLGIEWIRLEGAGFATGKDALKAHRAMQEQVYGKFIREHPDFYIEGCQAGGQRFDLNMLRVTHGTWISDHTGEPDVTRFYQTGALRAYPARFLNMAVEVHKNTGDSLANGHNILSRMVTALSFGGAISEWSDEATARVKKLVDLYKQTRRHREQPVFFPLPQPRSDSQWDAAVYGDGSGEAQLLFVFRMEGDAEQFLPIPDAPGKWRLLVDNGGARMKQTKGGCLISLNRNSSALWIRER